MWKETVVAYFVTFSRNVPGGNQEQKCNISKNKDGPQNEIQSRAPRTK